MPRAVPRPGAPRKPAGSVATCAPRRCGTASAGPGSPPTPQPSAGTCCGGVQGLSGALASSNLPKLLTPSGTHSPLGQGQTVPGLKSVGCPLQGPKAVKEEDVEGDEDDEARGRGQRSRIGI